MTTSDQKIDPRIQKLIDLACQAQEEQTAAELSKALRGADASGAGG